MLERSCRWPLLIGKASVAAYMHPVQLVKVDEGLAIVGWGWGDELGAGIEK
jgi:hypothetical protein